MMSRDDSATVAVSEKPILMNGAMVRATLRDVDPKSQTRRVIKRISGKGSISEFGPSDTAGYDWHFRDKRMLWNDVNEDWLLEHCPYGAPGDHLWVRETWDGVRLTGGSSLVSYRADGDTPVHDDGKWRPSIHMPRWASRITLEVTGVRVERVQDISESDALAEGVYATEVYGEEESKATITSMPPRLDYRSPFKSLWDSINAKRGFGWDVNPHVWVVEFKVIKEAG